MPEKIAHYENLSPIGAGGMGEVYRATDTRLQRDVAIKILPESLASDPERLARFDREAKTLASLQHANVATVYDFTRADGKSFLVMELVEGEDLAERLERGPFPPDEARDLAIQLAAGLEAAHERNIVHRDLKPANVKLTPDGRVKILDFGLARAVTGDVEDGSDPMLSPTITQAMTQAGTILGTAAYMSPEQARGKSVDKRADIWAFGVLLYEMLTGRRLFEGETTSDTLASVLKSPVDFDELDASISADMRWVLQRCLDRNASRRLRDIGEARLVLSGESTASQIGMPAAPDESSRRSILWPVVSAVLLLALVGSFVMRPSPDPAPLFRAALPMPEAVNLVLGSRQPGPPALAPDGSAVVFSGQDGTGTVRLWYRRLDTPEPRALEGTEGGSYPFWSPDSRSVGFFSDNNLMRLDLGSGSPLRLAEGAFGKGGTWNEAGVIVYAPSYATPLSRISARGGDLPRAVTVFDSTAGDNSHRHPFFLPDGEHFLYLARGARDSAGAVGNSIRVGSLQGDVGQFVTGADGHAEFHDGRILFARDEALVAQPFDPKTHRLTGDPRVILPEVESLGAAARSVFTIARTGLLIYAEPYLNADNDHVTIFDRTGQVKGTVGDPGTITRVVVSPDRKRAAVVHGEGGPSATSVWLLDLERGTRSRFASGEGSGILSPVWSPDGRFLAYAQAREGEMTTMVRRVDGGGKPVQIASADIGCSPESWSPDGRFLTYTVRFQGIYFVEMDESGRPVSDPKVIVDEAGEAVSWGSCFLGNSEWIAYHSSTPGTFEIFVTHVDDPSRRFQITSQGAIYPCYNPVTGELGYSELGVDMLTAVSVEFPVPGGDPVFGTPVRLFRLPTRELDNPVDFYGDTVILGSGPGNSSDAMPLMVSDWRRLLTD
jgi:serine/threonine protein kinase